jgi:uncharacterized BrkB/YihY/UPF0761 family membrane protein
MTDRALGLLLALVIYAGTLVWMGETQGWSWATAGAAVLMSAIFSVVLWFAMMLIYWFVKSALDAWGAALELGAWFRGLLRR